MDMVQRLISTEGLKRVVLIVGEYSANGDKQIYFNILQYLESLLRNVTDLLLAHWS